MPLKQRRLKWWLGGVLGLLLATLLSAYFIAPVLLSHAIVDAPDSGKAIDPDGDPDGTRLLELGVTAHHRLSVGPPEASLSLYQIDPPNGIDLKGTVLVLHGIHDRKESQVEMGKFVAGLGYRVILVDLRGHGRSTGKYLTYGVVESRDCRQVLNRLDERRLLVQPVGAVGFSYGGAVALQLAAIDPRVVAVVTVSTFASLREVLGDYVAEYLPIVSRLLTRRQLDEAVERAGRLADFDPAQTDTALAARATSAHLLIIHGARDGRIPPFHARRIHVAASARSELLILEGEDHETIMADRNGEIKPRIRRWFEEWMRLP